MTLYDIRGEFMRLYELAIEDDDEQAFLDTLEGLKGELEVKAAGYVQVMKQIEMEETECDKVIEEFKAKKQRRVNSYKRMSEALMSAMETAGVDTLSAGDYELKIVNNGGLQPLEITGNVPDSFMKVIVEPDNKKIREALNHTDLEFARLGERGKHLKIK